jgi:hypothetical protein
MREACRRPLVCDRSWRTKNGQWTGGGVWYYAELAQGFVRHGIDVQDGLFSSVVRGHPPARGGTAVDP